MIQRSSVFSKESTESAPILSNHEDLEKLVTPYLETEVPFERVSRNFRYSHIHGLVFDAFKEQGISFEVKPLYYLKEHTPKEVLDKIQSIPNIVMTGAEVDDDDEKILCYSRVGSGAPILVGEQVSDYYIGKKYHQKIKGVEPVYEWGDYSNNQLRGATAVIAKTRGINITGNGSSRLYEASLSNELYQSYILKGGTKVYSRRLLFDSYDLMCNLGHPSTYKITLLEGVYLPKTFDQLHFDFCVDGTSFGEDLDSALVHATGTRASELVIKCNEDVMTRLAFGNWKFIKHAVAALKEVDFNTIGNA